MDRTTEAKQRAAALYGEIQNWRRVARIHYPGVPAMTVWRFATDPTWTPKASKLRHAFGLPHMAPAPVCDMCGEVHVAKSCPKAKRPRRSQASIGVAFAGVGSCECQKCGRVEVVSGMADKRTAAAQMRRAGWLLADSGPICPKCAQGDQ
jgi:hypothetical protein